MTIVGVSKPCLSPLPLILSLTLTLLTLLTLIDPPQTLDYRCNSHFRCYCGGIYRRGRKSYSLAYTYAIWYCIVRKFWYIQK